MKTVQVLIDNAMYMSLFDREYQSAIPGNLQDAALNTLINIFDENRNNIPYHGSVQISSLAELENTKFTKISQLDYILGGVKYPVLERTESEFNRESGILGLKGPPEIFHFYNLPQTIRVYPEPRTEQNFIIHGYMAFEAMALTDPIPSNMPPFMQSYITYSLAERLCIENNRQWSSDKARKLEELRVLVANSSDIDTTPPISIEISSDTGGKGDFPFFYYLSGGGQRT